MGLALVFEVAGKVHSRHTARTQLALDGVAVCQGSLQALKVGTNMTPVAGALTIGSGLSGHQTFVLI